MYQGQCSWNRAAIGPFEKWFLVASTVCFLAMLNLLAGTVRYSYDGAGRLILVDYGDGVVKSFTYDASGNLVDQEVTSPVGFAFPFYQADGASFTGFAVSNFSDRVARLNMSALRRDGQLQGFASNPSSIDLQSGRQLALLGNQIFGVDAATVQDAWVKMSTDNADIGSFFLVGSGVRLDGSGVFTRQAKTFHFTRAFEGPAAFRGQAATTLLSIGNPNNEMINMKLTLFGATAGRAPVAETTESIAARGFLLKSLSELFGAAGSISSGYVEVNVMDGEGALGFELIRLDGRETVIGLNADFGNRGNQAFSAQLANGEQAPGVSFFTDVKLVNVSGEARSVTVRAIGEDGNLLGTAAQVSLADGEFLEQDAGSLLGLGSNAVSPVVVGSIRVEADGPGVIGDVIFGDPSLFKFAASLPMQTQTFTKAIFSQVANAAGFFTGVALYNPGRSTATVTIEVITEEGALTGATTLSLAGGKRFSKLLVELVPESAGQLRGYIVIRSTLPLIGQEVFADSALNFLAAVPPTIQP